MNALSAIFHKLRGWGSMSRLVWLECRIVQKQKHMHDEQRSKKDPKNSFYMLQKALFVPGEFSQLLAAFDSLCKSKSTVV
ncbi:hypothetical protein HJC23_002692 [Cyclotella cryptica]|uniref:Uncharacterized protein n=1 Tax=Cyclotella cryptica TaxID=29204 RepID=A0ABD3NGL8_9STRA